jgi:tripartite-type tricarboxylate transporter receptor subunit TctC
MPWLLKKPLYDPIKDFTPIAGIGGFSFVIVVHPSMPAKTMREFEAIAKSRPGEIPYGAPGGSAQICAETLARRTHMKLIAVPYKSSPQSLLELIDGQIGMICSDFATAVPHIKAGRLRALALTTYQRSSELPNVPTLKETYRDFPEIRSWIGAFAPAGTPREVTDWVGREMLAVTGQPGFIAKMAPLGFTLLPMSAAQLGEFAQAELKKWGVLIREAGMEPQ